MDGRSVNLFMIINVICFVRDFKYNGFFIIFFYFSMSVMLFLLWFHDVVDKNVSFILCRDLSPSCLVT